MKTCNNCKAFDEGFNICTLGYSIEVSKRFQGIAITYSPIDKTCPKPLTIKKFVELFNRQ